MNGRHIWQQISESEQKAGGDYQLLLFDGHSPHVTTSFLSYLIIRLFHAVFHLIQHTDPNPLTFLFFSYKNYYRKELSNRCANRQYVVSKKTFKR